jgi:predicted RNase H-like nuclease
MHQLVKTAQALTNNEKPAVVALDIPLSMIPTTTRREADNAISRAFGARGCSPHTPNSARPGIISHSIGEELRQLGYRLAIAETEPGPNHFIEVYPHTALLTLFTTNYRVPYKVANAAKYWPNDPLEQRMKRVLDQFWAIANRLDEEIAGVLEALN